MTHTPQWLQERSDLLATLTEWRERAEKAERELADERDNIAHADAYQKAAMGNLARAEAAEAKLARVHGVLADFARQKKTTELETEYEVLNAAFEDAYDMFIDRSRAALKAMEATDE